MRDLHILPRLRDGLSYLYVEHCRVDQDQKAVAFHDVEGKVPVPCAALALLMLGPGTTITHAAVRTLAEHGCSILWCGEGAVRFYAQGIGETRRAANLMHQARLWADPRTRARVVERLYEMRFDDGLPPGLDIRQIRGREGVRVREAYARASRASGVEWVGRNYKRQDWRSADPVNRALSAANSCLYGVCHAAILSAGYSAGLGFIHTGKQLSFVYDIADLYKVDITIPTAFSAVASASEGELEREVRLTCRDAFRQQRLLPRVVEDIERALDVGDLEVELALGDMDSDDALPGGIWDPVDGLVAGGTNYGEESLEVDSGRDDAGEGTDLSTG
ncbi:MAG: type I-E CRISPR-associated endonuclease Cas1e [Thermoleophilia bacterium]